MKQAVKDRPWPKCRTSRNVTSKGETSCRALASFLTVSSNCPTGTKRYSRLMRGGHQLACLSYQKLRLKWKPFLGASVTCRLSNKTGHSTSDCFWPTSSRASSSNGMAPASQNSKLYRQSNCCSELAYPLRANWQARLYSTLLLYTGPVINLDIRLWTCSKRESSRFFRPWDFCSNAFEEFKFGIEVVLSTLMVNIFWALFLA
jgi:hypothetical protein